VPCEWWDNAPGTSSESWPTILVNSGYLNAPDVNKGYDPTQKSVFYCPEGNPDFLPAFTSSNGPNAVPSSRIDMAGAGARKVTSKSTGIGVEYWYGINGSTNGADQGSVPLIRSCADNETAGSTNYSQYMTKISQINRSAETVFIYDGVYMNFGVNSARVNARHGKQTQTNLLFFDGHAQTYRTVELPGGLGVGNATDFSLNNLKNYPSPAPKWRLDQN
jgi:prepilin-type processing-associated H-X9-DG protein